MRQWKSELFLGSKLPCAYPPEKKKKRQELNTIQVVNDTHYNNSCREFCQVVRKIVIHPIGDGSDMEACPCPGQDGKRGF